MDFGLDLGYGRYQFTLETAGTMNNSQLLQPLTFNDVTYAKGLGVDFTWVQLTAGYAILDRPYWRIAPYAGFAVTSIAQSIAKKNASIRDSYSVIGGISADYKFRKKIILGEARNGIFYEQSLKMRIGLNNVILSQDLYGSNGIATLSYCISLSGVQ